MTTAASRPALPAAPAHRAVFARIGKNVAWLIGGRGFTGITSLAYLAIAARTMGPHSFGEFTLALVYGQLIANITQFQSWQGVIRYGAIHIAEGRSDRLARLLGFSATLDIGSALAGALLAIAGSWIAGAFLDWSQAEQICAALFSAVLVLSISATPTGMLRLQDRFDLLTYAQTVSPTVRLIGSIVAWVASDGVGAFLAVWAAAMLLQSIAIWAIAIVATRQTLDFGIANNRQAVAENAGIWRFMWVTNLSSCCGLLWEQVGTLAVGGVAGATAAGGFRIASRLAKSIAKPVQTMSKVIYPELARLVASRDHATLGQVMTRVTLIAAGLSLLIVIVAGFGGSLLLTIVAGADYRFAHMMLFMLAIASAIDLAGFAIEPLLNAHGRATPVLAAKVAGLGAYGVLLAVLLPNYGPMGAAVATIIGMALVKLPLIGPTWRLLKRDDERAPEVVAPTQPGAQAATA